MIHIWEIIQREHVYWHKYNIKYLGDGSFVSPFLTDEGYFNHLKTGFHIIDDQFAAALEEAKINGNFEDIVNAVPYSKALKGLYFTRWEPPIKPDDILSSSPSSLSTNSSSIDTFWWVYLLIAIGIAALIISIIILILKYKNYCKNKKDGYQPIKTNNNKLNNENSNKSVVNVNTALIPIW